MNNFQRERITDDDVKRLCFYELKNEFTKLGFNDRGTKFLSSGWCDLFLGWIRSVAKQKDAQ
jgi:hypothetical protein